MQTKELNYKGKKLVYRTAGTGPVVILLHGFGEDGTVWKGQYDLFPGFQLLVPDLPGSGRSEAIADMSMEGLAEAIKALVDAEAAPPPPKGGLADAQGQPGHDASSLLAENNFEYVTADPLYYSLLKEFVKAHRSRPTQAEDALWQQLRAKHLAGYKFRRQHIVGKYIADFICLPEKLIVEVDGLIHQLPENKETDEARTHWLQNKGYRVVRFSNEEVINQSEKVLHTILQELNRNNRSAEADTSEGCAEAYPPLGGGGAVLIGHSMGGYVTLAFAEKYGERLRGFGLFHSTAFADSEEKKETRRKSIRFIREHGAAEFLETATPNLYAPQTREIHPEWIGEHLAATHNFSAASLVSYSEAMIQRPDRTAVLKESKVPVLFVMGHHDGAAPLQDVLKQCHLPQIAYIHILEKSGHMGMIEEGNEANQILSQFVNATEKTA